jgi:ABC-2 type transport system ATP-binding protein
MPIVRVQDLVRYYGAHRALDGVSFSIEKGEIIGVLGLNGAGKSTCLRILAGLLTPTAGRAEVDGRDVLDDPIGVRARVGFLPEDPPLYREMTVEAFLRHAGQLKGMTRAEADARIPEVCDRTGLDAVTRKRIIDELSHGYRKRVGIAQAILHKPALVILDEPISGLDPAQIVEMRRTIRALEGEHTVMVSSHILTEISQTCDRILVIHDGRLVAEGTEESLVGRAGGRIELTVRGDAGALETLLGEQPAVTEHRVFAGEDGLVEATVSLADEAREALVAALVGAGFGVRKVAESESELESVFLGLTRNAAATEQVPETETEEKEVA